MTPANTSISLSDFQQAIAQLDVRRPLTAPRYARRKVLATAGPFCALCDKPFDHSNPRGFDHPVIASCVHTFLGGPLVVDNLFVCCRRCQQARSSSDLLTHPNLPDDLLAQRSAALLLSDNHLVHLPKSATLDDVRTTLAARHTFPRSRVYAAQADDGSCFIGVGSRYGDDQSKGLAHFLARFAGSLVHQDKQLKVYELPDAAFRRTVWELIEANALVVGVARRSVLRDRQDYWWLTTASIGELRIGRVAGVSVPFDEAPRQVGQRAVRARKLTARRRLERQLREAEGVLAQADAQAEMLMEARANTSGSAFPTDPGEGLEMLRQWALAQELVDQLRAQLAQARTRCSYQS
ncbi:hypothetical protein [Luteimonas sp. MC1750]|uniref:hypothetical protein n=1 Tax=Luteimonas sp. MC1750 TaxID=2799326 RepID=UPI0018F0E300|nr:hypothetical protein [Luteimonas sp. MC1750]MBJ6984030.1 hypothetical protein [Luteimonas sp. MC1750]QQO06842.1 hypothetical protein JGR68_05290 [Luteimonas sp. MC1750]